MKRNHSLLILGVIVVCLMSAGESSAKTKKSITISPKTCGCIQEAGETGWGSCMKSCLIAWGVPSNMVWACTATLTLGPEAVIACLGVSEYIVLGCNQYCIWTGGKEIGGLWP